MTACSYQYQGNGLWFIGLGVQVELPEGYYLELVERSSFTKTGFTFANKVGIIDQNYRGELIFPVRWRRKPAYIEAQQLIDFIQEKISKELIGNRIAQAILRKRHDADVVFVDDLSETDRGEDGFGSTGK